MPENVYISIDLGQVNDYTAYTIIERKNKEYHLRHIERSELGTPYPRIIERIKNITASAELAEFRLKTIILDITGVGRPVWDLVKQAKIKANLKGITITGGNTVTRDGNISSVPKRDLISALQIVFQNKQLKIPPQLLEAETFVNELINFRVKINVNGHDTYEPWREGTHDDIVLSAAMGVWTAMQSSFLENYKNLI